MSTRSDGARRTAVGIDAARLFPSPRTLSLLGLVALTVGYCSTLYWVTTVAGGTAWLAGGIAVGLGLGVLFRGVQERRVLQIAGIGAVLGGVWYYTSAVPTIDPQMITRVTTDSVSMLSGISVLELAAVDVWIAALIPIPVFLTTYFALRGRYEYAVAAGGWLLVFLALTGDATLLETLLGTVGAVLALGFGELDRRDGAVTAADLLVALVAVMAVFAVVVPMVPSGSASALEPQGVGGDSGGASAQQATPLDEQLLDGDDVTAGGPINLSPDVRFVVESPSQQRWRVGVLDTYTGDSWTQSGLSSPYLGTLDGPPGSARTVLQQYQLRTEATDLPAAAYPIGVRNLDRNNVDVTSTGALTVDGRLPNGTNYTIESSVPTPTVNQLRTAGTDYPLSIEERYTGLPQYTVPERVSNLTDQVTSQSSNSFESARAIESYLEDNKEYSQNVSAPSGTLADSFLFEMDAGYCVYYAGTMATMLRTQGIPARVAVGYTSGQYVGNDTWVVRGTDAHAWVEVYFPDVGWVEFDPTPTGDVRDARRNAVETARTNESASVDVPESSGEELRFDQPENTTTTPTPNGTDGAPNGSTTNGTNTSDSDSGLDRGGLYSGVGYSIEGNGSSVDYVQPNVTTLGGTAADGENGSLPNATTERSGDRLLGGFDTLVIALLLVAGAVAGGRQAGLQHRIRDRGAVLWQRRRDPETDVERAMERLDALLARRYGARESGQTRREYRRRLPRSVDSRVHRAFELHERARYAGDIDRATADELVELVDDLARRDLPVLGDRE
ncbi:transglutaminase domain-containing protein [Salinarchaeum sp. Harcht-Bsk1]|uniref:DUF3488 and transglutaminase-like domain-containing protein n=1 Tax=Salinarchaeum sp. Harcht-Bsk1 TaxID=1333523 RepID=UPI0003423102|nr:transglutaminaseTgpA domain-containing protein [Salinarchaeum sp. Harcht-Bsk1]AGN02453.1 transglutaminase domain-containing protein [Salinarchaeum sp. Harcht-Bsk1]